MVASMVYNMCQNKQKVEVVFYFACASTLRDSLEQVLDVMRISVRNTPGNMRVCPKKRMSSRGDGWLALPPFFGTPTSKHASFNTFISDTQGIIISNDRIDAR